MKSYLNEKGSLPLVLLIVFVLTMSVVALTSLHITETINLSLSATKDVDRIYKEDSVREMTLHAFQQFLQTKIIEDVDGGNVLTNDDLLTLETVVNSDILPDYGLESYHVYLELANTPPTINYFCSATYDALNATTDGYDCLNETFDVGLTVQIQQGNTLRSVLLEASGLILQPTPDKQTIVLNTSQTTYVFRKN